MLHAWFSQINNTASMRLTDELQLRHKTMDVTQWQDKWSHTLYLCAPAADARLASLACELQNSQWNVEVGAGGVGRGQYQAPATENAHSSQVWHSEHSDYNILPWKHTWGMLTTNITNNAFITRVKRPLQVQRRLFCCLLLGLSQTVRKFTDSFTEVL